MEKIKSLQELRMQRELLELQQMISELRVKKDMEEIRQRFRIKNNIVPIATTLVRFGMKNNVLGGVLQIATDNLPRLLKRKKTGKSDKGIYKWIESIVNRNRKLKTKN